MNSFFQKLILVSLVLVMLLCSVLSVSAYSSLEINDGYEILPIDNPDIEATRVIENSEPTAESQMTRDEFVPGVVLVSFNKGCRPSLDKLLPGFKIVGSRLIAPNVHLITFEEKTTEIVLKAVEILQASPYVRCAEPDYYMYFQPFIEGDADGDGVLSIRDATLIQKYLVNEISREQIDYLSANISRSGDLSICDATIIQKRIAGLS